MGTQKTGRVLGTVTAMGLVAAMAAPAWRGRNVTVSEQVSRGRSSLPVQPSLTANITARPLTVGGALVVASTKTYDRTTTASITDSTQLTLVNVPAGDAGNASKVALTGLGASYSDKTVATGKTVTLTAASLTGTTSSNYTLSLTGSPTTTADITLRSLNVTITATNKTYNQSSAASVTYADNRVSGDVFTVSGTATFPDKNVGTARTVTASSITLTGADAANYTQNTTATTTASITRRTLTVTAAVNDKTYDGNNTATVTLSDDRVTGDVLTVSRTAATFPDKNAGTTRTVTVTGITIAGTDSGNYTQNTTATTTASITRRTIAIGIVANDKTYDGSTAAEVTYTDNRISGDTLQVTGTAAFADKNAGAGKIVTASSLAVSGADSGNYTHGSGSTTTASITRRQLTVTAAARDKRYDASNAATVDF